MPKRKLFESFEEFSRRRLSEQEGGEDEEEEGVPQELLDQFEVVGFTLGDLQRTAERKEADVEWRYEYSDEGKSTLAGENDKGTVWFAVTEDDMLRLLKKWDEFENAFSEVKSDSEAERFASEWGISIKEKEE